MFLKPKKIYSRQQGNTTFNFYTSQNGQLIGEAIQNDEAKQLCVSVLSDLQTGLDEEKIRNLRDLFRHCYFDARHGKILVNVRGRGGWDDEQHYGDNGKDESTKGEGTFVWAFPGAGFTEKEARIIASANVGVDGFLKGFIGYTSPVVTGETTRLSDIPQGWHFNTSALTDDAQRKQNGTMQDTRIVHAVFSLDVAVNLAKQKDTDGSLFHLGCGLHALQDVFAHTSDFVTVSNDYAPLGVKIQRYSHFLTPSYKDGSEADNPMFIHPDKSPQTTITDDEESIVQGKNFSQRYSDTKTMSLIYFFIYRNARQIEHRRVTGDDNMVWMECSRRKWSAIEHRLQDHIPKVDAFDLGEFLKEIGYRLPIPEQLKPYLPKVKIEKTENVDKTDTQDESEIPFYVS